MNIAIDFSQAGDSTHHTLDLKKNQYLQAIESVGKILFNYDTDKKVPMFGFGGIPTNKSASKANNGDHFSQGRHSHRR
jgi:hypothetical protein